MKKIAETERLILRELTPEDAEHFFSLNQNPNVLKYTGDSSFTSVEEARNFLKNYKDYERNGYGRWAVVDKNNYTFLGWCGLKYHEETRETDIGFRFFEEYWNKGYASESAAASLNYGFEKLNLPKIIGRAMIGNTASIRVLQKMGMIFDREFDFDGNNGVIYTIEDLRK